MLLEDLIHQFILLKKRKPSHTSELLDYIKKSYMYGELTVTEYKKLFLELNLKSTKQNRKLMSVT